MLRLKISCYLTREETRKEALSLQSDMTLSRSHVDVHMGGIDAAIESLETDVQVLIVEDDTQDTETFLSHVNRLAEVITHDVAVILLSPINDVSLYKTVLDMGVGDYLKTHVMKKDLITSLHKVSESEEDEKKGHIVSVIGAKGGVGSSILAHHLASDLSKKLSIPTTLVDLDMSFGTAALNFGKEPRYELRDIIEKYVKLKIFDVESLNQISVKIDDNFWLIASNPKTDIVSDWNETVMDDVIHNIALTTSVLVLDIPHQWDSVIGNILLSSDDIVIVSDGSLASLRNTQIMHDELLKSKAEHTRLHYVLNMSGFDKELDIRPSDYEESMAFAPVAVFPFNPAVFRESTEKGVLIPEDKRTKDIRTSLSVLRDAVSPLNIKPIEEKPPETLFDKIKAMFAK